MPAGKFRFQLKSLRWLSPTVMGINFHCSRRLRFQGGQFLSLFVPDLLNGKTVKRAYSFASSPDSSDIELCVKYRSGGAGSEYLLSLKPGDAFEASAPYGHFVFHPSPNPNVCFVATSTGIAPFRSIVQSGVFREHPKKTLLLYGATDEREILYPGEFERLGIETIHALSRAGNKGAHFKGRVSDYLKQLPHAWSWHNTDFYLCGSGKMIHDVLEI